VARITLNVEEGRLKNEWQYLERQMLSNRFLWNDSMRQEFDAVYWQPIAADTSEYLKALAELTDVIAEVERFLSRY
jgi:hypothetical protein